MISVNGSAFFLTLITLEKEMQSLQLNKVKYERKARTDLNILVIC